MKKFNDIRIDATSTDRIRADFTFERTAHKEIIFKSYALQMMSILIVMPVSLCFSLINVYYSAMQGCKNASQFIRSLCSLG